MRERKLLVTCEHAGNAVPHRFQYLFRDAESDLLSHKGWDPGALMIAGALRSYFHAPIHKYEFTRLLIEPNRSLKHPQLFSKYSQPLDKTVKKYLIDTYYTPYRRAVEGRIGALIEEGVQVLHLSVHTFTPVWDGVPREVEIGLLFDEQRKREVKFCETWERELKLCSDYRVFSNEPYNGADDGLTTTLRKKFASQAYLGIELEVSQKFFNAKIQSVIKVLESTLDRTLN